MEAIQTPVPQYHIEYIKRKTGQVVDVSEEGYATLELCEAAIAVQKQQDKELENELLEQYEEAMKNFIFDLDTSDREPVLIDISRLTYPKKSQLYYHSERRGFTKVEKHKIEGLSSLQADPETIEVVNGILTGSVNPRCYSTVNKWIRDCFNTPHQDEIKMHAINHVLEGYGIESLRTSVWQNGYWCDILCTYINMGDNCIPTIINHREHGFMVGAICEVILNDKNVI